MTTSGVPTRSNASAKAARRTSGDAAPQRDAPRPPSASVSARSGDAPLRGRRRPLLLAIGAVLVLVSAIASYVAFTNLSASVTVVVATADIHRGETIEASDLGTLEILGGQSSSAVLAADASTLVGRHAAVDLLAGALITTGSVQESLPIDAGHSIVGISVGAGQVPSSGLTSGDVVRIVSTPIPQGEPPQDAPPTIEARVFMTRADELTGGLIVDVMVPSHLAADLAARAATGRIAIVLDAAPE